MSVWGGLIARDVTEIATDGDAEDVAELADHVARLERAGNRDPAPRTTAD